MNGHARSAHVRLKLIFVSTILIIGPAAVARAQDLDDVSFSGVVSDVSGAVVAGASVTARLAATGAGVSSRLGSHKVGYRPSDVVEVTLARVSDSLLTVTPKAELEPGEYLISFGYGSLRYDFSLSPSNDSGKK